MPFRKCKYCDKPAKINYYYIKKEKRRHKGYFRTCGSEECLNRQYKDKRVCQSKKFINKGIKSICPHCNNEFTKEHFNHKWCKKCVPDSASRSIMQRYNISKPEYLEMININKNCPICLRKLINPVIDHCHKTKKVRGMICNHCNVSLAIIEDKDKLQRALEYIKI